MYSKEKEISGHSGAIYAVGCFNGYIYTGSADGFITRWLRNEGIQDKFAINMSQPVYALDCIDDRFLIAGLSSGAVHVFDLLEKKEIKHFVQHIKAVFEVKDNPLKRHFYCADSDGNLSVWNSDSLELLLYLPLDCGKIRRITVSKDGERIALASQDGMIRIFETTGYNELLTWSAHKDGATVASFHALDEDLLLSGGKDALLKIWNWKTMELIQSIPAHNYVIYDIVFLEGGKTFATASRDKTIKIWDSATIKVEQRLDIKSGGHRHSVNALAKLDEVVFVSVSDDKRIILWNKQ